jgi:CIC family chloride channel protein
MRLPGQSWSRAVAWIQDLISRRWRQLLAWRERWRPRADTIHLLLAGAVGVIGGLTNAIFHSANQGLKLLILGQPGDPAEIAEWLNPWLRFAVPACGGLVAGLILHWGLRMVPGTAASNLLEVVVAGDGRLPFRVNLIKTLSSLLSVSTGASVGREGPITQMSATLASKGGQWVQAPPYRLRLLVACGAAAGLAAAYNAPIAGAVFAAQIVLGNFAMNLFAPLVCASVIAAVVSRSFFGIEPLYRVPEFEFTRVIQLPWFLVLGALAGGLGALFLRLLQSGEALARRLNQPVFIRLFLAGVGVGVIALLVPEVWGNGYAVTSRILESSPRYDLLLLGCLLAAKLVATVITVGAGTVGGVLTPTLFLGAALGSLAGSLLHLAGIAEPLPKAAFALAGMGSVLAATTHSPLMAMILVFEISLNYSLMPAVMLACAVATLVSRRLHPASVYTEPLRQKGLLEETESQRIGAATQQTVGDLMHESIPPVPETATLREIGQRFLTCSRNFLPVVDAEGRLSGLVALQDLKAYLNAGPGFEAVIAYDVMRPPPPCLTPNMRLHEALPLLLSSELRHLPVVNNRNERRLVGSLVRAEALSLFSEAIATKN